MLLHEEVLASAAGGVLSTLLGHPLDCIKVRMQTGGGTGSAWAVAANMLRHEGVSSFCRGITAPLANSIIMNSVMFVAFAEGRKRLPDGASGALLAGAFSGIVQAKLTTPLDWAKIQAQCMKSSMGTGSRGSGVIFLDALRKHPWLVYTGHTMNLCREGVFTALYLGLYSHVRRASDGNGDGSSGLMSVAITSATTGAIAWLACYPFDTIKSVQQARASSPAKGKAATIRQAVSAILQQGGGLGGFYAGAGSSTLRAMLVTCSRLVAYESVAAIVTSAEAAL